MIEITEKAATQIQKMLTKRALGEAGLRVGVKAGGCSGFEYIFRWEQSPKHTDVVFEGQDGAKVFVDPKSLRLLDGTALLRHKPAQQRIRLPQPEREEHMRVRRLVQRIAGARRESCPWHGQNRIADS